MLKEKYPDVWHEVFGGERRTHVRMGRSEFVYVAVENLSAIGSPGRVTEKLKFFVENGVDELMCFPSMGPQIPNEKIMKSIELFATQVVPKLKAAATGEPAPATA